MPKISYVDIDAVVILIGIIKEDKDSMFWKYLPSVDKYWIENIGDCVERAYFMSKHQRADIYETAARLFYNIAKGHFTGDGNKRSALMCVVAFLIFNDHFIKSPDAMYLFARRIARSKGSKRSAFWLRECAKFFKQNSVPIE